MYSRTKLRELLDHQGRRNDWLADQTGYTEESVSRYLGGTWPMSEEFASRAAAALGIPVHWLREREIANV